MRYHVHDEEGVSERDYPKRDDNEQCGEEAELNEFLTLLPAPLAHLLRIIREEDRPPA